MGKNSDSENQAFQLWRANQSPETEQALVKKLTAHARAITYGVFGQPNPEVINDSIRIVLMSPEKFSGKSLFSTWFHKLVTGQALNVVEHRRRRLSSGPVQEVHHSEETHPIAVYGNISEVDLWQDFTTIFSNPTDLALALGLMEGATLMELASELDMSLGKVHYRMKAVKEKIASYLRKNQ